MDNQNNGKNKKPDDDFEVTKITDTVKRQKITPNDQPKPTDLTVLPKAGAKPAHPAAKEARSANVYGDLNSEHSRQPRDESYHLKGRDIKSGRQKLYDINKRKASADDELVVEKHRKHAASEETEEREGYVFSGLLKVVLYIFLVVTVSIILAYNFIMVANDVFAFVKSPFSVDVTVKENSDLDDITQLLYENKLIKYPDVFKIYIKYRKTDKDFNAGTYTLSSMMNYDEFVAKFRRKVSDREIVRITIPEGFTIDEIIGLMVKNGIGTKDKYVEVINKNEFKYEFVKRLSLDTLSPDRKYRLEGYLFPDTYEFYKSASEIEVITKFLNNFENKFSELFYKRCENLGMTVDEVITLASMIEREAKQFDHFPIVSSVFHNRLMNSSAFPYLESDATIQYSLPDHKNELTHADITLDLPYNTYNHKGLPPSAICNPGYEAITAALYPDTTGYFYFVSDNKGNIYFNETKAGHDAKIEELRRALEE